MSALPRIMIIDDEAQIRSVLVSYLEDYEEFSIATAASAEEALQVLEADPADLCIVDMRLPGMNGAEFISNARTVCRSFLVHTGSIDDELTMQLRGLGVAEEDYLMKPCCMSRLLERIRSRLG